MADTASHPSLVSVIIVTHKRPAWLRRAIESALAQTYQDFEVIVVENGSTEGRAVVETFRAAGAPVRYLHRRQAGQYAARNLGFQAARGRYVAFLDDDDEWLPAKLEEQLAVMERDPAIGLAACHGIQVNEGGDAQELQNPWFKGIASFEALVTQWCWIWSPSAVVVRRDCVDRIGGFTTRYTIAADYEFYLRVARYFKLAYMAKPLYRYHRHGGNVTRSLYRVWREVLGVQASLRPSPEQGVSRRVIRETIRRQCQQAYRRAVDARRAGRYADALQAFYTAIRFDPLIGTRIAWSRVDHPLYRSLRPYAAMLLCAVKAATTGHAR